MNNYTESINKIVYKAKEFNCTVLIDDELKKFTSFRIGGKCNVIILLNSQKSISELFSLCNSLNVPFLVLGKGSNMLIDDNGFDGITFVISKDFSGIRLLDDTTIECNAGCAVATVAYFAYKHGLSGLEFAWGIPGTAGGAVVMNAGAYGGEISDVVLSTNQVDTNGKITSFSKEMLDLSYRHSVFSSGGYIITKVVFKLIKKDKNEIKSQMDDYLLRRKSKQPLEYASAGSTFKRPEGAYAARLIEQCGLKGASVGDAQVSEKHNGFVINKGNASFNDVITLINKIKKVVFDKSGYNLDCEVKIIESKNE